MRAAWYSRNGPAREVLEVGELPTPTAGPGEVLVRVAFSGVNPSDWKARSGIRALSGDLVVPHSDGSGVIAAVGEGVDPGRVGQRVWTWNAQWNRALGTAADYVALPSAQAVALHDGVPLEVGAALGIPAMTAWRAIDIDGGVKGQTVLVQGAAGAVGHYAVQFARLAGAAMVIGTASSPEKAEVAREAGADHVINRHTEDVGARVKALTDGRGVDRIVEVDLSGNLDTYPGILASEATVSIYGTTEQTLTLKIGGLTMLGAALRFFVVYNLPPQARARGLAAVTDALVQGRLRHRLGDRYPLSRIAAAHEAVEAGASAKVLIELDAAKERLTV